MFNLGLLTEDFFFCCCKSHWHAKIQLMIWRQACSFHWQKKGAFSQEIVFQ